MRGRKVRAAKNIVTKSKEVIPVGTEGLVIGVRHPNLLVQFDGRNGFPVQVQYTEVVLL